MPRHDDDGGTWYAVGGKAEKDAARREQKRERKEARRLAAEEEATRAPVGGVAGATSFYTEYQRPVLQQHVEEEIDDSALLSVKERKKIEAQRKKQEDDESRVRRAEEAAAQKRRQDARDRAAKSRDPASWPDLGEMLGGGGGGVATELIEKLDALHADPLCCDNAALRLQYAVTTTRAVLGDRVRDFSSQEEAAALWASGSEAVDALFAHGRSESTKLLELLVALKSLRFWTPQVFDAADTVALRFAAEGVLRGGAYVCAQELEMALTFFAPQLFDSNSGVQALAEKQLRWVWRTVLSQVEIELLGACGDDATTEWIAQLTAGCVRVLNCVSKLKAAEPIILNQLLRLSGAVCRICERVNFVGTAVHANVPKILLQPEAPSRLLNITAGSNGGDAAMAATAGLAREREQDLLVFLLLCGPRHHGTFTKMTLPTLIKRVACPVAVHCCASCLASTADEDNVVAQAPIGDRFNSIVKTEAFARVLKAVGAGPIEQTLHEELSTATAAGGADAATAGHLLKRISTKKLLGLRRRDNSPSLKPSSTKKVAAGAAGAAPAAAAAAPYQPPLAPRVPTAAGKRAAGDEDGGSMGFVVLLLVLFSFAMWAMSIVLRTPEQFFERLAALGIPTDGVRQMVKTVNGMVQHFQPQQKK